MNETDNRTFPDSMRLSQFWAVFAFLLSLVGYTVLLFLSVCFCFLVTLSSISLSALFAILFIVVQPCYYYFARRLAGTYVSRGFVITVMILLGLATTFIVVPNFLRAHKRTAAAPSLQDLRVLDVAADQNTKDDAPSSLSNSPPIISAPFEPQPLRLEADTSVLWTSTSKDTSAPSPETNSWKW